MIKKNIYTILVSAVIAYLSLANARTFENIGFFDIPYLDKFVHFGLYFLFMAILIFEHRNSFENTRQLILVALIPIIFGSLMEFLQGGLTQTRKADLLDAIFNSMGVATSLGLWLLIKPYYRKQVR